MRVMLTSPSWRVPKPNQSLAWPISISVPTVASDAQSSAEAGGTAESGSSTRESSESPAHSVPLPCLLWTDSVALKSSSSGGDGGGGIGGIGGARSGASVARLQFLPLASDRTNPSASLADSVSASLWASRVAACCDASGLRKSVSLTLAECLCTDTSLRDVDDEFARGSPTAGVFLSSAPPMASMSLRSKSASKAATGLAAKFGLEGAVGKVAFAGAAARALAGACGRVAFLRGAWSIGGGGEPGGNGGGGPPGGSGGVTSSPSEAPPTET